MILLCFVSLWSFVVVVVVVMCVCCYFFMGRVLFWLVRFVCVCGLLFVCFVCFVCVCVVVVFLLMFFEFSLTVYIL